MDETRRSAWSPHTAGRALARTGHSPPVPRPCYSTFTLVRSPPGPVQITIAAHLLRRLALRRPLVAARPAIWTPQRLPLLLLQSGLRAL